MLGKGNRFEKLDPESLNAARNAGLFRRDRYAHARLLVERRFDLDEFVGIEAVEAGAQAQRVGADMADLDPVAGVDRLRQVEGPRQDVDESQVAPQTRKGSSLSGEPLRRLRAGSGMKRVGSRSLPVQESEREAQTPSLM